MLNKIDFDSKKPQDREKILRFLQYAGFTVPPHGMAKDIYQQGDALGAFDCVVYFDNIKPQKMSLAQANKICPQNFSVLYLGDATLSSSTVTTKMVQIGNRSFWFDFKSEDNWRSNQGKWKSKLQMVSPGYHKVIKIPLFSIDFIKTNTTYAIDFDLIPACGKTSLVKVISRKEASTLIKQAYRDLEFLT